MFYGPHRLHLAPPTSPCTCASARKTFFLPMNPRHCLVYTCANKLSMRLFLLFFIVLPGSFPAAASVLPSDTETVGPAPFVDLLHARHEGDFYDRQAREWEALAYGDCATDEAWFHYYKTAYYSNRFGSGSYDLAAILAAAEKVCDPEGFDLHYIQFAHDPNPETNAEHLLAAYAADPERAEAYPAMITYYEVNGLEKKRDATLKKMHEEDPIPAGVMEYNFNQLQSVDPGGTLITHGDTDTYPTWLLQSAYNVRTDVRIVCLPLVLGFNDYRSRILGKELAAESRDQLLADLIKELEAAPQPLHLAATANYLDQLDQANLYLTGLAFRYSKTPVDNIGLLAKNYRSNWRLDQLRQPLTNGPGQAVADQLNQNYLPALLELHELQQKEPANRFDGLLPLLETLAERAGQSIELATYLRGDNPPQLASKNPGLRAKDIFKGTAYIPNGIYTTQEKKLKTTISDFRMQTTEVSNGDYQLFLEDLLRQRRFDLLDSVAVLPIDLEKLKDVFPEGYNMEAYQLHLAGSHPNLKDYPLVNVSHRAAELYAIWLAQVYNQDPKRPDGKNVFFRLPTKLDFAYAAKGGRNSVVYPWGGNYYRNSKGCLLANFNTLAPESKEEFMAWKKRVKESTRLDEKKKEELLAELESGCNWQKDGGDLTVKVSAYFPNDYGLYNMSGNAAEMLMEDGVTIGGSWMDPSYYMQIEVVKERILPHPSTGFRLVMEYVD